MVLRLEKEQPDLDVVEQFARAIEPMLNDLSQRTRETGVSVLGSVGDDQSIRALREFMQHETIESLRERAQKAIDSIREGRDDEQPEDSEVIDRINALEDRVEELQRELTEASERH
jgi:HEAT repeat protein